MQRREGRTERKKERKNATANKEEDDLVEMNFNMSFVSSLEDNSVNQQRVIYHPMKFNQMKPIRNLPNQHQ